FHDFYSFSCHCLSFFEAKLKNYHGKWHNGGRNGLLTGTIATGKWHNCHRKKSKSGTMSAGKLPLNFKFKVAQFAPESLAQYHRKRWHNEDRNIQSDN